MRVTSLAVAAALTVTCISASLRGQRPDDQIDARSMALLARGKAAEAAGNLQGAADLIETSLAVDPRNRAAFKALAEVARASGLPGKAIRLYREALLLEPNDAEALRGQGEALVQKGAVNRAKDNLTKLRALCHAGPCPQATELAAVIDKGPPVTTAQTAPPASAAHTP